jgi:hypothetical protein
VRAVLTSPVVKVRPFLLDRRAGTMKVLWVRAGQDSVQSDLQ